MDIKMVFPHKILLVDDDSVSNFINKSLLEDLNVDGKNIEIANNGQEALKIIDKKCKPIGNCCPTLIFLDLKMPVMDGFEFLEKFNADIDLKSRTIIYLLTSSSNPKDVERAEMLQVSGYISKPLTKEKLKNVLE